MICSPSVQNVLDRLYVSAVTMGQEPIEYANCIDVLHKIESRNYKDSCSKTNILGKGWIICC